MIKLCSLFTILSFGVSQAVVKALPLCPKEISDGLYSEHNLTPPPFKLFTSGLVDWPKEGMYRMDQRSCPKRRKVAEAELILISSVDDFKWRNPYCPNVSTTPITAMGCRQCLPLSVVQLKSKHCQKPHCRNGDVDMFGPSHSLYLDI